MIGAGHARTSGRWSLLHFSLLLTAAITFSLRAEAQSLDAEEQTMLRLINEYRAQSGLSQLAASIALTNAAEWMSNDMAANNRFNHVDSLGRDPFARIAAFGYNHRTTEGENIAAGSGSAVNIFNAWKNSPEHNAVMLNPSFNVIGVARAYNSGAYYGWYWTADFGGFVDATIPGGGGGASQTVKVANAASYFQTVSPGSIAAAFNSQFDSQFSPLTLSATSLPLQTTLGGASVTVNDIAAELLFVSPSQINFVVPPNVGAGTATVKVTYNGAPVGEGTAAVENVSPGVFTAMANGQGVASALTTFDGVSYQPVINANGAARAISAGTETQPAYLVLYGTGIRGRSGLGAVRVTVGGVALTVDYAGPQSQYAGLDQINVKLLPALRGQGFVDVVVTVDGRVSNKTWINIGN